MTRIPATAAKAIATARKSSSRPMWMAQAETMAVSDDIAADEWERVEARLVADLEAEFGAAIECAKTANEVKT